MWVLLTQLAVCCSAMDDVNSRVSTLRLLVSLLPAVNRDTLWYLMTFLSCVVKHCSDQLDDAGHMVSHLPSCPPVKVTRI